jgi:hypothetical protein
MTPFFLRYTLLIFVGFLLQSCSTSSKTSQGSQQPKVYDEDLTGYLTIYPNVETPKKIVLTSKKMTNEGTEPTPTVKEMKEMPNNHDNLRVDSLLTALYDFSQNIKSVQGYRILVYSGTEREEAQKIETDIEANLQERADMSYDKPNFRVHVGSYIQRLEAYKTYVKLRKNYPNAIIVLDKIGIEARRRR